MCITKYFLSPVALCFSAALPTLTPLDPKMPSPQGFPNDSNYNSEDESHEVPVIKNPKEIMLILKKFSFLGILQSKINFLYTCLLLSLVPKGFSIKWSEQTGFESASLREAVRLALDSASLNLQNIVLKESLETFKDNLNSLMSLKPNLPQKDWSKGMKSYQFLFNQASQRHLKKLNSLLPDASLHPFFPLINFQNSQENLNLPCRSIPLVSEPNVEIPNPSTFITSLAVQPQVQLEPNQGTSNIDLDPITPQPGPSTSTENIVALSPIPSSPEMLHLMVPTPSASAPPELEVTRPIAFNKMVFTPDLNNPVPYDPVNFQPICIDGVTIPASLQELSALSPSFSPTPTNLQPPDGNILHQNLMEFKKTLSWNNKFRMIDFKNSSSVQEFVDMERPQFVKPPWYEKSTATPPSLPNSLDEAFTKIYSTIMNPCNWFKYKQNLPPQLRSAISLARGLPSQGIGIYSQDKSSRICFASLELTNQKVEQILADTSKYKRLPHDGAISYQNKIKSWYSKFKPDLKAIPEDISKFLLPSNVSTPHLKVLIKTHKPNCPVRLTFSSIGSATCNLSNALDFTYLKPIFSSGLCSRRLQDTREALAFVEKVNEYLWDNDVTLRPVMFALDVKNFFPSVPQSLALPAISYFLKRQGFQDREIKAVTEGLKVVRNGNFFKWKENFYTQISGCALGDPDSCSYSDLSMAYLLNDLIPSCEQQLSIQLDPFFKIFRDDGLGVVFCDPSVILDILGFFNSFNEHIQWTVPICKICSVPEATCHHYEQLEFLDCLFTWQQYPKGDKLIWQFSAKSFSKSTDCHAYLSPLSCTAPHLDSRGVSVAKTVGTRLRTIHSSDEDLLTSLNLYSGYLIARGYDEESIKYHLANMANRSRISLINGDFGKSSSFILPLVTQLHPAITVLSKVTKKAIQDASKVDPILQYIIPSSSLVVAYKKLPNLQLLLCKNDQNSLAEYTVPDTIYGYQPSQCKCLVCKASRFGKYIRSPALPNYTFRIPENTNCKSGPHVIYHLVCTSPKPECSLAHYVGRAFVSDPKKYAMPSRWSCHKYHHKKGHLNCEMTKHLFNFHRGEDAQNFVKIQIIQTAKTVEEAIDLELVWQRRLFAFKPTGLCVREEDNREDC